MDIRIKRAYDKPGKDDGYRVLVDRLWPRGIKKESLGIDEWSKDVAPSTELRKWFNHEADKFKEFSSRYYAELRASDVPHKLLQNAGQHKTLTLVCAAKDPVVNHAAVLQKYLEELAKE